MNPVESVTIYREQMARRLRLNASVKGLAVVLTLALSFTLGFAWLLTQLDPSPEALLYSRISLFLCLGMSAIPAAALPITRLGPMAVARRVEKKFPQFSERLVTLTESRHNHAADPFQMLLAEDTLGIARGATPEQLVDCGKILSVAAMGAGAGFLLMWLVLWSRGPVAAEARALWTDKNEFAVELKPFRKTVLRGSAVIAAAHLNGFSAKKADLLVRYAGSQDWKTIPMLPGNDRSEFVFTFSRLSASAELYARTEGIRSCVSIVKAIDLPRVTKIEASYEQSGTTSGDIVAPIGTQATLRIETDRPMTAAELVVEPGDSLNLPATTNNATTASLRVLRDAEYHVSVRYEGDLVQVSDEHEIEVLMMDKSHPRPATPVNVRAGAIPVGYERAVAAYYKRLSEAQGGRP